VLGIVLLGAALLSPRTDRTGRTRAFVLLVWSLTGMAATVLSGEAPSFIRVLPALPAFMILPAWAAAAIWKKFDGTLRYLATAIVALIIVSSLVSTYTDYFTKFAAHPYVKYGFDVDNEQIATWIRENSRRGQIYLAPVLYQQGTIAFLTRTTNLKSFDSRDTLVLPPPVEGQDAIYAFPREQAQRAETTANRVPGGTRQDLVPVDGTPVLLTYQMPSKAMPRGNDALHALNLSTEPGRVVESAHSWENGIRLWGGRIIAAGLGRRQLQVILYVEAGQPVSEDLTFSIKVMDEGGRTWGQQDKMPGSNSYPTRWWSAGELIIERFYPEFEECAPPGEYRLTVELYNLETGRVSAVPGLNGNAMELGTIYAVENCAWDVGNGTEHNQP
jgi:hypothetical protein